MVLWGRDAERATVDELLARARDGRSGVLVVHGEAGIGKTALLEHARAAAPDFRVHGVAGVEAEMPFAFAGLHQLCAPFRDQLAALPAPQQGALGVALGRHAGDQPDRFLVGLATLGLLAEAAEHQPLLCLVDDAQWLDPASAQTLAFVARRVGAERLALIFTWRGAGAGEVLAGLPDLPLNRLDDADARTLLAAATHTPLDDQVRDRILAEARGNPLALWELARGAHPGRTTALAGGFGLPDVLSVPQRVEEGYRQRSANLPADTQLLLLAAAADPTGEPTLLLRAADHLRIGADAAAPAESAGLLDIGTRVRFPHPLARSAVYRAAAAPDRRRVHGALAAATDPHTEPDRHTWHRAQAVLGTDETVAAALERSAGRARARGGLAAAAAFLERAVALTPDPDTRAGRALAAARAHHQAGASDAAGRLLAVATTRPSDALHRARSELLRAQIAFVRDRGSDVPGRLLDAAKLLAPLDAPMSRDTYLQAMEAAIHAGSLGAGRGIVEVAEAAGNAPPPAGAPGPADLLLDGLVALHTGGFEAAVPALRAALAAYREQQTADASRHGLWLATGIACLLMDDVLLDELPGRQARLAREAGALTTLATALNFHASVLPFMGELARADEHLAEAAAIMQTTGAPLLPRSALTIAVWRGRKGAAMTAYDAVVADATRCGEGTAVSLAHYLIAVLHNGLGEYDAALAAAAEPVASAELAHSSIACPELVEAAVRAGRPHDAAAALERFTPRARASGTAWALGLDARSRALTSAGQAADDLYRESLHLLEGCRMAVDRTRTHLVYGEWLRREGRRREAREHLRTAHEQFTAMGTEAFAARAARELRATGERPRTRTQPDGTGLTAQERQIARLVATGATSREIGTQLFLSTRTIEAHLRNIFRKLDITSRRELRTMRLS